MAKIMMESGKWSGFWYWYEEHYLYACVCALAAAMAWRSTCRSSDTCIPDYGSSRAYWMPACWRRLCRSAGTSWPFYRPATCASDDVWPDSRRSNTSCHSRDTRDPHCPPVWAPRRLSCDLGSTRSKVPIPDRHPYRRRSVLLTDKSPPARNTKDAAAKGESPKRRSPLNESQESLSRSQSVRRRASSVRLGLGPGFPSLGRWVETQEFCSPPQGTARFWAIPVADRWHCCDELRCPLPLPGSLPPVSSDCTVPRDTRMMFRYRIRWRHRKLVDRRCNRPVSRFSQDWNLRENEKKKRWYSN